MAIEFRCPGCAKLLRVADENAGKKAKCPQCGTIVDVPAATEAASGLGPPAPVPLPGPPAGDAGFFADAARPPQPYGADSLNPYASPNAAAPFAEAKPAAGPLQHSRVSIDDVLNRTWAILQSQLGQCALFGLVFLAITFGVSMATGAIRVVAQLANDPVVLVLGVVLQQVIGFFVNTFFQLGLTCFSVRLARTGEARLNDLFAGGPYYWRGLGGTLLLQLMMLGILVVFVGPAALTLLTEEPAIFVPALIVGVLIAGVLAVFLALRFYLMIVFIVDQNMRVMDAFRASAAYMAGNKLAAFLGGLIVSVLGGLVVLCTCMIGMVVVVPFAGLFLAAFYLLATGQPVHTPLSVKTVEPFRPANN